jgi:hypothetical protein
MVESTPAPLPRKRKAKIPHGNDDSCVRSGHDDGTVRLKMFVSNEYVPTKTTGPDGEILPDQKWQHPDPDPVTLSYNELGGLTSSGRIDLMLRAIFRLGCAEMGGHMRVIDTHDMTVVDGRLQSWETRHENEEAERLAHEQERLRQEERVFEYCNHCQARTESCKDARHRGINSCMECGGARIGAQVASLRSLIFRSSTSSVEPNILARKR